MTTFFHITDINRFFRVIDACKDGIFLQTHEGHYVDIRNNSLIKTLLTMSCGRNGVEKLDVRVTNANDMINLLRYMMDCNCKNSLYNQ